MVVRITQRNLCLKVEAKGRQHNVDNVHHIEELLLHLIGTAEQVGIVLCERANTRQAVQLAALLITIHGAKLCNAQRQVTV